MALDREKKKLESKVAKMEVQKSAADQQAEEHRVRVTELEVQKSSLEVILKVANERKIDIAPLREHALLLRRKIYQVQVKLAEEAFWIKQSRRPPARDLNSSYYIQGQNLGNY